MRCCVCKRPVVAGIEATKMVVEYGQADGSTKLFGLATPGGPLSGATGQILRGWHSKCFHLTRKREARGDAVTGRVLSGAPTGYEIAGMVLSRDDLEALGLSDEEAAQRSTLFLAERMQRLREVAARVGKAVGDPGVVEAFRAQERGGPYEHGHHLPMEPYQTREHLRYAHGCDLGAVADVATRHDELHAGQRLGDIRAQRDQDPGHTEPVDTDWRQQVAVDITTLGGTQ